jgi:hypothetical protein
LFFAGNHPAESGKKPKKQEKLFRVLDDGELVHPVHQGMALFDNALQFATDTGNEFVAGKEITGIHRLLFCPQEIGLDPVFLEFYPFDQAGFLEFLDDTGALAAVYSQFFPEFALQDAFGF